MSVHDEQVIRQEVEAFSQAWNTGDTQALAVFFTEDAVRVDAFGDVQRGRGEIATAFRSLLHGRMAGARVRVEPGTVRLLSPELALWQGGMEILLPQGPPLRGHVLHVMRREGNRWLILEAHPKLFPQFSLQGPQLQTEEVEP